jgi:hypothetical protein
MVQMWQALGVGVVLILFVSSEDDESSQGKYNSGNRLRRGDYQHMKMTVRQHYSAVADIR